MSKDKEDIKRTRRVTVRFTNEEYERLIAMAKDDLKSRTENISRLIRENVFYRNNDMYMKRMALDIKRLRLELTSAIKRYETTKSEMARDDLIEVMNELDKKLKIYEMEIGNGNNDPKAYKNQ